MPWPAEYEEIGGMVPDSLFEKSDRVGLPVPDHWYPRVRLLFPTYTVAPFAKRHAEMWDWAAALEPGIAPENHFVGIWPRGGAKSTSAELITTDLGVRGVRNYGWYVRGVQEAADTSVQNIGGLLESDAIARHFPAHSEREVSKFGFAKGWRVNRLRTAGGFTVDAIGLDTAARGVKVDEDRPDFIIIDDIDGKHDSLKVAAKKIEILTTSILPAMARHGAVLSIQNLIIPHGFFARIVKGEADYLANRIVSGPHPAVTGCEIAMQPDPETGVLKPVIVRGKATWAGQNMADCQHLLSTIGKDAFEKECQHDVFGKKEGLALRYEPSVHVEDLTDDRAKELIRTAIRSRTMSIFGGVDFGAWRFGFDLNVVDSNGVVHQVSEWFSQREDKELGIPPSSLEARAKAIDAIMSHYGCPRGTPIWGDVANQTDIMELNLALHRIGSKYSVVAVAVGNKGRQASVERLNDLFDRRAMYLRRDVVQATAAILAKTFPRIDPQRWREWRVGYSVASKGKVLTDTSRLRWEMTEWAYEPAEEGEEQAQDPADESADGADLIAARRYGIMSWWTLTQDPLAGKSRHEDIDRTEIVSGVAKLAGQTDEMMKKFEEQQRKALQPKSRSVFTRNRGKGTRKVDL